MDLFPSTELRESPGWGRLDTCSADLYHTSHPPTGEGPCLATHTKQGMGTVQGSGITMGWLSLTRELDFFHRTVCVTGKFTQYSFKKFPLSESAGGTLAVTCTHLSCSSFLCLTKVHCSQTWISEIESWWYLRPTPCSLKKRLVENFNAFLNNLPYHIVLQTSKIISTSFAARNIIKERLYQANWSLSRNDTFSL